MRTSLQTALRAGSMVSPARRMDTPVILETEQLRKIKMEIFKMKMTPGRKRRVLTLFP